MREEQRVERCTRMLDEMWTERGRLAKLREETDVLSWEGERVIISFIDRDSKDETRK